MNPTGRRPVTLPVQTNEGVFCQGIRKAPADSDREEGRRRRGSKREIRIRFEEGGFIHRGLFAHILHIMEDREVGYSELFERGPVSIEASRTEGGITMEVAIEITAEGDQSPRTVRPYLDEVSVAEIEKRVTQIDALLFDYRLDADDEAVRTSVTSGSSTAATG